jgi:hypothetical protein
MQNTTGELHRALMDLVGIINRPKPDEILLQKAGVSLDRALFPLLVRVDLYGPLGVVELAEWSMTERRDLTRLLRKLVDSANQALLAAEDESK